MPKRSAILLAGRLLAGLAALPAAASADPVAAGTVAPLAAETAIPDPASVTGAAGLDDPVLSFGLARVADWSTARPFLDLARMMRPWIGHRPGQWGGMTYEEILQRMLINFLTALGYGRGNLNDSMMEKVTNAGNGVYEYAYESNNHTPDPEAHQILEIEIVRTDVAAGES